MVARLHHVLPDLHAIGLDTWLGYSCGACDARARLGVRRTTHAAGEAGLRGTVCPNSRLPDKPATLLSTHPLPTVLSANDADLLRLWFLIQYRSL